MCNDYPINQKGEKKFLRMHGKGWRQIDNSNNNNSLR